MNTSHLLDAVRYITGLEVERVSAEIATLVASVEVEDTAAATLRYDNGAIGSIFAGAHVAGASPGGERFEIYGSRGQLHLPDPYGSEGLQVYLWQAWEEIPAGKWHTLPAQKTNVYLAALEEFTNALICGNSPPTSGQDARQVLAIILAIYRSAVEHRAINISEVDMVE
jgi:predicted dehydrogenase